MSLGSQGREASDKPYLRLHSIDVFVRNQERSLKFFLDTLGFDLAFDAQLQSGQRWVAVSPPDGTAVLTLIEPDPSSPNYKLIGRATRAIFVTENVAQTFRAWSARGVHFRHTPRLRRIKYQNRQGPIWGEVFTRFEDVDHNSFTLLSLDEVSKAIEAQRSENARRLEEQRRLAHELEIARQVQARLFPQAFPDCKTLEYAGVCAQARHVGGDYYDFVRLGQGRLGLVIGDVAGKGIAAALLMANLQAHLRSLCTAMLDQPKSLLQSVNRLFYENTDPSAYATLFFGVYEEESRLLHYANCGHLCGLVLKTSGSVERLHSTCTVLGLFTEWECSMDHYRLSAGDVFALYTDGVTEAFDDEEREFGEEGLLRSLDRCQRLRPAQMVQTVLEDVRDFHAGEQQDDITLMIASCR